MKLPRPPRPPRLLDWLIPFAAGLSFALLMIAAFPPFSFWGCSLVALAPLVWLVERSGPNPRREPGADSATSAADVASGANGDQPRAPARGSDPGKRFAFRPALFAAIGIAPFYAVEHAWLWDVAGPGTPFVTLILILYPMLFVWTLIRVRRRWPRVPLVLAAPAMWAGLEHLRGAVAFDGYPWFYVGHPLIDWPWLAVLGTVVGAMGVSALACTSGGVVGWLLARPTPRRLLSAVCVVVGIGAVAFGLRALSYTSNLPQILPGATIRVGIVQTDLPQSNKMAWPPAERLRDLDWFLELTELVAQPDEQGRRPDLIVWPETMFPGATLDDQSRQAEATAGVYWNVEQPDGTQLRLAVAEVSQFLFDRQREMDIPLIVGAIARDNLRYEVGNARGVEDHSFNSVYAIHDGHVIGRYDKVHLTPFGEVMPYISAWPWLEKQLLGFAAAGMSFDLSASTNPRVLEVPVTLDTSTNQGTSFEPQFARADLIRIATPICFESTDAALCRRLVNLAHGPLRTDGKPSTPVVIVNPTNDGWFGNSNPTREQHLQLARWRAIENRVPVVRAANTGISCAIDHHGRVLARGVRRPDDPPGYRGPASLADGIIVTELPLAGGRTIYSRFGDCLGRSLMYLSAPLLVAACWPIRRAKPESGSDKGR